jgi:hypothetical protein
MACRGRRRVFPRSYFKNPDGHPLEVLHFPPDKGREKWHESTGKLFLGIDHTAIVVWDTDASVKFSACKSQERARIAEPSRSI